MLLYNDERPAVRRFTCDVCEQSFMQAEDCIDHMKTHTKKKIHKCDVEACNKTFPRQEELLDHKTRNHGDGSVHYCQECDASFPKLGSLKRHMKAHAETKRRFTCEFCQKNFPRTGDLMRHRHIHTGQVAERTFLLPHSLPLNLLLFHINLWG